MESHECVTTETKICKYCGATKSADMFRPKTSQCKECVKLYHQQHYRANRVKVLARQKARQVLKRDEIKQYSADWYIRNKADVLARCREYRSNPATRERELERQRLYYAARAREIQDLRKARMTDERKERFAAYQKVHYLDNPGYYTEKTVRRRRAQLGATPAWADLKAIRKIYRMAAQISKESGTAHHVDHIIPLQGRKVCGLHVEYNLRIIPAMENRSKSNKFLEG